MVGCMEEWSFLTNHAQALLCIAHDPGVRLRDIAAALGITERSAYAIVNDLAGAGYVIKVKDGRRNRYELQGHLPLPDPIIRSGTVGEVLALLIGDSGAVAPVARRRSPVAMSGSVGRADFV
jgi:DNA-binding transcriptional ArsR family regulator